MSLAHIGFPAPGWRWFKDRLWDLEHAFQRARTAGRAQDDVRLRILFILAVFSFAFLGLAVGAARMALFPSNVRDFGAGGLDGTARAKLVDRNGVLLAADLPHYGLYLDPREVWDVPETRRALKSVLPDLQDSRLDKVFASGRRTFIAGGLSPSEHARVHDLGLPGLLFEPESKRVYPLGGVAAHVIGISDSGGMGLSGAEAGLNAAIRDPNSAGHPVPLSIDLRVQAALDSEVGKAAQIFQAKGAVGVVTNVRTGEILALTSYPNYDPNQAGKAPDYALLNRAAGSVYEMGSTFKVFTVAMALDSGKVNMGTVFNTSQTMNLGSRAIHDHDKVDYNMTVSEVFLKSSNIGASRIALQTGGDTMTKYFEAFGLFKAAPVELRESARPILPRKWNEDTVASASFGHAISVSPLALVAGIGSIMNGGNYVPLTLHPIAPGTVMTGRRVVSPQTSRQMLDLMRLNAVKGTGTHANIPGLRVGGKTGSAEKALGGHYVRDKLVSSFAAVFPTDGPLEADRYLVLVMLDEPVGSKESFGLRTGGWTAAPAAGRVIDRIAPFLKVQRHLDVPGTVVVAQAPDAAAAAER